MDNAGTLFPPSQFNQASETLGLNLNFGLHVVDFNIQKGDIIELIKHQYADWSDP